MLAASIRERVKIVDPTMPVVGLRTLEESRMNTPVIAERLLQMRLMLAFAIVALVVSAIGIYGVSAYATAARRREFGIRTAPGASSRGVVWLVFREVAQVAALGALVGVPIAVAPASRFRDLLYGVTPVDPWTLGAVLGTLAVLASAASILPARRATLIDPIRTMRTD
jgi:putative ABC transport system permease protein